MTTKMLLAEKIGKFNAQANEHLEKQSLNPFSGRFSRSPSPRLSKEEYGRPLPGSKTEQRGQKAKSHVNKEIMELCDCIHDVGVHNLELRRKDPDFDAEEDDGTIIVTFGELFQIYTKINDKVVGLLIAAKKRGFVYFEKEILFQRRDDDVLIALVKPIQEIRGIMRESLTPSPMPSGCSSSRTPSPSGSRGNSEEPGGSGEEGIISSGKAKPPTEVEGATGIADVRPNLPEEGSCPVKLEVTEADDSGVGGVPESLPFEGVPVDPVNVREEGRAGETTADPLEESQTEKEDLDGGEGEREEGDDVGRPSTIGEDDQVARGLENDEEVAGALEKDFQVTGDLDKDVQIAGDLEKDVQVAGDLKNDDHVARNTEKDVQVVGGSEKDASEEISAKETSGVNESQDNPSLEGIQEDVEVDRDSGEKPGSTALELEERISQETCFEGISVGTDPSGEGMNPNNEPAERKLEEIEEAVEGLAMTSPSDQPKEEFSNDEVPEKAPEEAECQEEDKHRESLPQPFEADQSDGIHLEIESTATVQGDKETISTDEPSARNKPEESPLAIDCI